uniref:Sorting nexin 24 n=1 Tax=Gadus morhua TaxID=8049 RepID=A0A8C4ZK05_GADMO
MPPIRVSIPSFRSEISSLEKGYTVFKIDVLMNGRQHAIEKRYSEFHALHKMLKKSIKPPEVPSKHVRNWVPKVLEQRRHGLELYLQTIIMENEVLPKIFLDFLNIRHFPSVPKTESCGSPNLHLNPSLFPSLDTFANVVSEGVIHGVFYPDLQPR